VRLAHALGLQVVAEGVESEVQLARLQAIGCEYAQGFLLQVPLPADQLQLHTLERNGKVLQSAQHHSFAPHG
jgi:EAL domain-containing protein (putative c-di-GMP-specific phosphodiesterase class I)